MAANTGFALRLLEELQKEDSDGNVFISPLSVSTVLSMAYNGAGGSTREAMAKTLGLEGMSIDEVNSGYADLIESLEGSDRNVFVNLCDSIWIEESFARMAKASFTDSMEKYYGGEAYVRDFNSQTLDEINAWVSNQTRGEITRIVDDIDRLSMVLANTIYFRGNWSMPFVQSRTSDANFTLQDGRVVRVPMMYSEYVFGYYRDASTGAEVLRLPYGRGKLSMYVMLPPMGEELGSYVASLNQVKLDSYITGMNSTELVVRFPKLSLEYGSVDLKAALTELGMGVAFQPGIADFTGVADEGLWLDKVVHKAVVEINEKGTTAAGASHAGLMLSDVKPPPLNVDRPFAFMIRDDRTDSILFMGEVLDPTLYVSP